MVGRLTLTLLNITFGAIKSGKQYTEAYNVPFWSYFATNYDLYVAFITTALATTSLRSSLLRNTIQVRFTWFAILYCTAYLGAVFLLHLSYILQIIYYWLHLINVSM